MFNKPSPTEDLKISVGEANVITVNVTDVSDPVEDTIQLTLTSQLGAETYSFNPTPGPSIETDLTWTPTASTFNGSLQ